MAILKKYKILKEPTNKSQKEFIGYLKYGKILKRKLSWQIQYNKIESMINSGILEEVNQDFDFYVRFDKSVMEF